jgi:predicted phosphodiesterase
MKTTKLVNVIAKGKKKYLLPFGDWHIGHKTCDIEKIKGYRTWALKNNAWVIGMGDLFENATIGSPSVYDQTIPTDDQKDLIYDMLLPLAKKGLILGLIQGNHEHRSWKETGNNLTKDICRALQVPYLGYSAFIRAKVGSQTYIIFATHGATGSRFTHTKLQKCVGLSAFVDADCYLMGHVHELASIAKLKRYIHTKNKVIRAKRQFFILTGHYLNYDDSYADMKNLEPSKLGSPRIRLNGEHWDLHTSI